MGVLFAGNCVRKHVCVAKRNRVSVSIRVLGCKRLIRQRPMVIPNARTIQISGTTTSSTSEAECGVPLRVICCALVDFGSP